MLIMMRAAEPGTAQQGSRSCRLRRVVPMTIEVEPAGGPAPQ
jgi:hypothetical protein